jgi:4-hydroxy-2-oxoheptanedioate aldolase
LAELRQNKVKRILKEGGVATVLSGLMTPDLVEFFGPFGFDGVWIEAEHGPVDFKDIPDFTRACDLWSMTSVVRVNLNLPGVIYRTLDLGAQAIVVPHVNTAEEARAVVSAAKYYPIGERGNYTSRQGIGVEDFQAKANAETMVIVLIEDIVAVDNLADILKVDEIDVFFVAQGDLAQSMGYLGKAGHPKVVATAERALGQIASAGRTPGTTVSDSDLESYLAAGARFLYTAWTPWVAAGSRAFLKRVAAASA